MSGGGAERPARFAGVCPHDGTRLVPLADTLNWFRCGAPGWKHYFYRDEAQEMIDVDTNRPVSVDALRPRRKLPRP